MYHIRYSCNQETTPSSENHSLR